MSIVSNITNCRICNSSQLTNVISLGEQQITSRFPVYGDNSTPKTPIDLCLCGECGLLQLLQTTFASELYEYEYGYRSGINHTMRTHLKDYYEEIISKVDLQPGDTVIDIGSNDSTLLQNYSPDYTRIGVDPTGKQFQQYYGDVQLLPTYFTYDNVKHRVGDSKAKVVSSISMFYDLPDPVQFAKDIHAFLEDDGIWTCEQSYLLTMLKTNSIDTICHEHLEYYSLRQIKEIADRADFKIIDVKFNDCNGGSFRIYLAKKNSQKHIENTGLINEILENETKHNLMTTQCYIDFMNNIHIEVSKLCNFIDSVNKNGKKVYIYGASTKGNCLLQYANIDESKIKYAVERNPNKVGKMTSTGIEIISEETMRQSPPDYLLVLPWHFRQEIIQREKEFLDNGGQFIFPFPQFEIIGSKPKLLITGCDGMIAHYVKEQFNDYLLYGIGHSTEAYEEHITKFYFDMKNYVELEHCLSVVHPDAIVHLAGISSSQYAFQNPMETLETNGMITAQLCNIIHKHGWKTKLFNASSSEIYKGHIDYTIQENDNNMFHSHPYSIAKIMGHSMVDFYRNTYGLPFSNGVIFTTESPLKKPVFLLNKIAEHIKEWKKGKKEALKVGNLDSYRNIIHASDVASAIHSILSQSSGNNYLICNEESHKICDLVIELYSLSSIEIELKDNIFYEKNSGLQIMFIEDIYTGTDSTPINIRGEANHLNKIGWKPLLSKSDILHQLL
jgi:GDP-mannose 4,6-dehydratase